MVTSNNVVTMIDGQIVSVSFLLECSVYMKLSGWRSGSDTNITRILCDKQVGAISSVNSEVVVSNKNLTIGGVDIGNKRTDVNTACFQSAPRTTGPLKLDDLSVAVGLEQNSRRVARTIPHHIVVHMESSFWSGGLNTNPLGSHVNGEEVVVL